jgi:hypothetical protein
VPARERRVPQGAGDEPPAAAAANAVLPASAGRPAEMCVAGRARRGGRGRGGAAGEGQLSVSSRSRMALRSAAAAAARSAASAADWAGETTGCAVGCGHGEPFSRTAAAWSCRSAYCCRKESCA